MRAAKSLLIATISLTNPFVVITLADATNSATAEPSESVLYSFKGGSDGSSPMGALVADRAGNLYGTTAEGGSSNCSTGCGTVFRLTPPSAQGGPWTETVLYRFTAGSDGAAPESNLIFDAAGSLYGTTAGGGDASSDGTVFRLTPPSAPGGAWTETVLYRFAGHRDGKVPLAGLVFDQKGNLYGTTTFGGATSAGIVFQLTPPATEGGPWTETVLHTFGHGNDGLDPEAGLIFDNRGALYGTTITGTVFKLTPPNWTESVLFNFTGGGNNGSWPCALISRKGSLYGLSRLGGSLANTGTAFQLSPTGGGTWTETALYSFTGGDDGGEPCGALSADQEGNLYGTASGNGLNIPGTVFQLTPPATPRGSWTETTLHKFGGGSDGVAPLAGVIFGKGGALYGTTSGGGSSGKGTVFRVAP
jgi:uncharacterized repeat protein (TIGR03803 family)